MRTIAAPPSVSLMLSMRSVGYTFEASVADLIDNSIAAGAGRVSILTGETPEPFLAFLDDGAGMTEGELVSAMTLGAIDPTAKRGKNDLGRFGLGLKTASLAHARCLTVLSKQGNTVVGARWDLDTLSAQGSWQLQLFSVDEMASVPEAHHLLSAAHATLVVWTKLDQLKIEVGNFQAGLDTILASLRDHLGLVFHRFLSGDASRLAIDINGNIVEGADPFLEKHKKTMKGPEERIRVEGADVRLRAFTLPVPSQISAADMDRARAHNGLRDTQGFYIYRNRRLVVAGSWFEMRPRQELDKLTRVRLDIPNSLDHLWQLDVKKSTARPPHIVRQKVKHLMEHTTEPSQKALNYRGRIVASDSIDRIWNLVQDRDGFRYEINREHPLVTAWKGTGSTESDPEALLRTLEECAPWEDAYTRHANDESVQRKDLDHDQLAGQARAISTILNTTDSAQLVEVLRNAEPFNLLSVAQLKTIASEATR